MDIDESLAAVIIQILAPFYIDLTEWACIYIVQGEFIKNSSIDYVSNLGLFNMIFPKRKIQKKFKKRFFFF